MKGIILTCVLSLTVAIFTAGCGGSGGAAGPSQSLATVASPFTGRWSGAWLTPTSHNGDIMVAVGTSGGINLQVIDVTVGATGTGSGQIDNQGHFTARYTWDSGGSSTAVGNLTRAPDGSVSGSMVQTDANGTTVSVAITLRLTGG